jgi:hypothetical protein
MPRTHIHRITQGAASQNYLREWETMTTNEIASNAGHVVKKTASNSDFFRFHAPHLHLSSLYGEDWFALKAEAFARFFGTPAFLVIQTFIVAI